MFVFGSEGGKKKGKLLLEKRGRRTADQKHCRSDRVVGIENRRRGKKWGGKKKVGQK